MIHLITHCHGMISIHDRVLIYLAAYITQPEDQIEDLADEEEEHGNSEADSPLLAYQWNRNEDLL
jgi:hypothetical protein